MKGNTMSVSPVSSSVIAAPVQTQNSDVSVLGKTKEFASENKEGMIVTSLAALAILAGAIIKIKKGKGPEDVAKAAGKVAEDVANLGPKIVPSTADPAAGAARQAIHLAKLDELEKLAYKRADEGVQEIQKGANYQKVRKLKKMNLSKSNKKIVTGKLRVARNSVLELEKAQQEARIINSETAKKASGKIKNVSQNLNTAKTVEEAETLAINAQKTADNARSAAVELRDGANTHRTNVKPPIFGPKLKLVFDDFLAA